MAKEQKVQKADMVTVYGTGLSKHMPEGVEFKVHSIAAETLIKKGSAVKEKPSGKSKKEDK